LFPGDFIIYRKLMDNNYIDILERDLNSLEEWAVEKNEVKSGKS